MNINNLSNNKLVKERILLINDKKQKVISKIKLNSDNINNICNLYVSHISNIIVENRNNEMFDNTIIEDIQLSETIINGLESIYSDWNKLLLIQISWEFIKQML